MERIMIIDDDSTSLAIGKAFLAEKYEVSLVMSGQQAIGALKGNSFPDLFLLDMLMPGMNGLDLLEIFKNDDRLKDIPVIFLTGERSIDLEIRGYQAGAADFLQKPVDRLLLELKIQHHLSVAKLRRENGVLRNRLKLLGAQ